MWQPYLGSTPLSKHGNEALGLHEAKAVPSKAFEAEALALVFTIRAQI